MTNNLGVRKSIGFQNINFRSVLHQYKYNLKLGDIVAGSIFSYELNGYLIDIGDNNSAFLPKREVSITNNVILTLKTIQEFFILSYDEQLSRLVLSIRRLEYLRIWKRVQQLKIEDSIIYIKVIAKNSGGLIVDLDGINGFLPNSHIINLVFKNTMIDTFIPLKFLIVEEKSNKLILSHKRAILSMSNLGMGSIINTKITQIKDYGVFVKAHNIQALLHVSEIPTIITNRLKIAFHINEYLKVIIIHIDTRQARLSVSIKQLFS